MPAVPFQPRQRLQQQGCRFKFLIQICIEGPCGGVHSLGKGFELVWARAQRGIPERRTYDFLHFRAHPVQTAAQGQHPFHNFSAFFRDEGWRRGRAVSVDVISPLGGSSVSTALSGSCYLKPPALPRVHDLSAHIWRHFREMWCSFCN